MAPDAAGENPVDGRDHSGGRGQALAADAWSRQDWPTLRSLLAGGAAADDVLWPLLTRRLSEHALTFGALPDADALRRFHTLLGRVAVR